MVFSDAELIPTAAATAAVQQQVPLVDGIEPRQRSRGVRGGARFPAASALQDAVAVDEADRPDGEHRLPRLLLVVRDVLGAAFA